jgi:protein Tex
MDTNYARRIAAELGLRNEQVDRVIGLLAEGATVPFISRYRKEVTGGLDEVAVISIRDRSVRLEELEKRRKTVLASIQEQGKLTPRLERKITAAETMAKLEDLYLPYRPKKRTRGIIARERGLEPLADALLADKIEAADPKSAFCRQFVDPKKDIPTVKEALAGARDIIAERVSETADLRSRLRGLFRNKAVLNSKAARQKTETAKDGEREKFRDYFDYSEEAARAPSHRVLAMFRGAKEGFLTVHILPEEGESVGIIEKQVLAAVRDPGCREQIQEAAADAYKRLIAPSLETELKNELKAKADEEAIRVFADNIRELLMAPPLGAKAVLAVDPGLRTGCKVTALSPQGDLLAYETIFPLPPHNKTAEAEQTVRRMAEQYEIEAAAVGNGTGGREAMAFFEQIQFRRPIILQQVNESGASVYSASEAARREFPNKDVTVRGAVSIGRRLMDPLSELVKIDPKSIGVGQYQHDVDQKKLKQALDDTVTSCVNRVGVEVNSASRELLEYVAGLTAKTAQAFVDHRTTHGPFKSRKEFLQVDGFGPKAFEQAGGFLRVRDGNNPLDGSAVHPERYELVARMAADAGCTVAGLMASEKLRGSIDIESYISNDIGLPTLKDILQELAKPGRDPRSRFEVFQFDESVHSMEDLREGMVLPGIITNVTNFGAFVDIGVHQDGLVHISEMADTFVKNPHDIAKAGQKVKVRVISVDIKRKRIGLSMKG